MDPPQILRIKRKRGQDPLQALILGDLQLAKRSKPLSPKGNSAPRALPKKSYYFHLAETDDHVTDSASVLEARGEKRKRQFVIPKQSDDALPRELAEMLDDLQMEDAPRAKKKRGRKRDEREEPEKTDEKAESDTSDAPDYVFDVYKLLTAETLTNANYPLSQIGYIRFYDDEEFDLLQLDDEKRSQTQIYSDDEDSNAESFYQNDYPEDEDAGTFSDLYEDDEDSFPPVIVDSAESAEAQAYLSSHVQADVAEPQHYDDLYDDFFDEEGNQVQELVQDYERQNFFANEEDDALALHRDRIFGKLQRMINEQ